MRSAAARYNTRSDTALRRAGPGLDSTAKTKTESGAGAGGHVGDVEPNSAEKGVYCSPESAVNTIEYGTPMCKPFRLLFLVLFLHTHDCY